MTHTNLIGLNWGSSQFRAYLMTSTGDLLDEMNSAKGITKCSRDEMVDIVSGVTSRWGSGLAIYASGMIGSNIGWTEAPYVTCPLSIAGFSQNLTPTNMGGTQVQIVPGLCCERSDGSPDILRGEEVEILGLMRNKTWVSHKSHFILLPGTHSKWVRVKDRRITDFMTSMSGEIYDRMTAQGLLSSIVEGPSVESPEFYDGLRRGMTGPEGMGAMLFQTRARVIRGKLHKGGASSYLRGLLIGSEISGALALYPEISDSDLALVGAPDVCNLYRAALSELNIACTVFDSKRACISGFNAIHLGAVRGHRNA